MRCWPGPDGTAPAVARVPPLSTGRCGLRAQVTEPPADPGGRELGGRERLFPGAAQIVDEASGEAELGVGGDDEPRPPVGGLGVADLRFGPAEGLLEQPECSPGVSLV